MGATRSRAWCSRAWTREPEHAEVTASLRTLVYFCDPASPWQRASNETLVAYFVSTSGKEMT